ncbi:hypothetical protein [Hymenobacter sp.]|uniref:hypothetical protein n=1 Tax=Hymenobacter sp. TaxID=1898978 RepID=UPI00286CBBD1|nr:hypothetical protein [Hymenobacter sp.]
MKPKLIVFAALVLLLNAGMGRRAAAQRVREEALKSSFGAKQKRAIKASVRADTLQQHSEKGLVAVLVISNDSTAAVVIKNPVDFLGIRLVDATGVDVFFPHRSRLTFDHKRRKVGEPDGVFRSLSIARVAIDDKPSQVNLWASDAVTIPAHGNMKVLLHITDVLQPNAAKPYTADKAVKIPTGSYSLGVSLGLGLALGNRFVESLHADPITIRYGD